MSIIEPVKYRHDASDPTWKELQKMMNWKNWEIAEGRDEDKRSTINKHFGLAYGSDAEIALEEYCLNIDNQLQAEIAILRPCPECETDGYFRDNGDYLCYNCRQHAEV